MPISGDSKQFVEELDTFSAKAKPFRKSVHIELKPDPMSLKKQTNQPLFKSGLAFLNSS